MPETELKIEILTRGVNFSKAALLLASQFNAKGQNLVYNAPKGYIAGRPQELFLTFDNYTTVVSCVSSHGLSEPVLIDVNSYGQLFCTITDEVVYKDVLIEFVPEPDYYNRKTSDGDFAKKYISACGYDELNIIPWKGCLISSICKFCGANNVAIQNPSDALHASHIAKDNHPWINVRDNYLKNLTESIRFALDSSCYDEHMHVILISGNLPNNQLDLQSDIYADIATTIHPLLKDRATEGLIAVISPPHDVKRLQLLKDSGIEIVVFNLEVANDPWFTKYCPGKSKLGRDFFIERLKQSVDIFGYGKSWTNFVLGLEPVNKLLSVCQDLARFGIVSSANVLHLDEGNRLDCVPPTKQQVIDFFYELSLINEQHNFSAFYCSKALRTSLSNEFQDKRYIL